MPTYSAPDQIAPTSLNDYLEVMSRAVFQTGMAWRVIAKKWPDIKEAFGGFDVRKVASLTDAEIDSLTGDKRVIRNGRKIAAITANAAKMLELDRAHGSFQSYLRAHGNFDATLKALKKDFKFMGPTDCYYFLYVVQERVPPHDVFVATYHKKS